MVIVCFYYYYFQIVLITNINGIYFPIHTYVFVFTKQLIAANILRVVYFFGTLC